MTAFHDDRRALRGFTLIELMAAIAVLGILLSMAVPSFQSMLLRSRLTSQTSDLVADVLYARSEAAARGRWIVICPSSDGSTCSSTDWADGRVVFVDSDRDGARTSGEPLLRSVSLLSGTPTLTLSGFSTSYLAFNPYGGLAPSGNAGTVKICLPAFAEGRLVTIGANGRPSSTSATCP